MNRRLGKLNKNSLFISWLTSYAIILIIPILISFLAYMQSINAVTDQVNRAHNSSLNQLKFAVDSKLDEIYRISSEVMLNQTIKNLMIANKYTEANDSINIRKVQSEDISKFKTSNSFIDDMYVYIKSKNYIFNDNDKYSADDFKYITKDQFGFTPNEFSKLVDKNQIKNFMIVNYLDSNNKRASKIIFFQSLYLSDLKSPQGALILVVDGSKVTQLLKNLQWSSQGEAVIVDNKNNFIDTSNIKALPYDLKYNSIRSDSHVIYRKLFNENTAVSHVESSSVNWEYISLIPTHIFLEKVQNIKQIIIIYIIACLLLGSAIAFVLAKRNYDPLKKLTQMITSRQGISSGEKDSEYNILENSLRTLFEENDSYVYRLKQQNEAIKNNVLVSIVKGRAKTKEKIDELLSAYEICFSGNTFLIALFAISNLEDENLYDINDNTINMINRLITNVINEHISLKHDGYMIDIDGMFAYLINIDITENQNIDAEAIEAEIIQTSQKTIEFVKQKCNISLSVSISGIHNELSEISKAYSEVLEVIEYNTLLGSTNEITNYMTIQSKNNYNISHSYNLEKDKQFINSIMIEDYSSAKTIMDEIMTGSFEKGTQSLPLIKCRLFGLINSMLNAVGEIITEQDIEFFDKLDPAKRLLSTKSINELKVQSDLIFDSIIEYYDTKKKLQIPQWIIEVEDYINNHYFEAELSITSISSIFNINNSYLSRSYKKFRGYGLLDYIHKVRLQKAKELMKTKLNINSIAEKVGYLESKAMIRAFKRYEGTTPGKFRESEALDKEPTYD